MESWISYQAIQKDVTRSTYMPAISQTIIILLTTITTFVETFMQVVQRLLWWRSLPYSCCGMRAATYSLLWKNFTLFKGSRKLKLFIFHKLACRCELAIKHTIIFFFKFTIWCIETPILSFFRRRPLPFLIRGQDQLFYQRANNDSSIVKIKLYSAAYIVLLHSSSFYAWYLQSFIVVCGRSAYSMHTNNYLLMAPEVFKSEAPVK